MKKFILLCMVLLLTACSSSNIKSLKVADLKSKLESKESFVLYLTDNSDESKSLKKTLDKVSEDNEVTVYSLVTENLSDKDQETLKDLITYEDSNILIFIKEGKENSTLSRVTNLYISESDLKEELKLQGYLK